MEKELRATSWSEDCKLSGTNEEMFKISSLYIYHGIDVTPKHIEPCFL